MATEMPSDQAKAKIRERYDHLAAAEVAGEVVGPARAYFRLRKLSTALDLGSFTSGACLLELGCARAQFTVSLAQRGYAVTGLDLSVASVDVARMRVRESRLMNVSFAVGDAENLQQFPDDTFDGVVSFSTLRYVLNLSAALSEIRRVLKPGGRAVIDFPNRFCPWFYLKQWLGSERHPYDHWFLASELRAHLREAGLRPLERRHILFTPTIAPDRLVSVFKGLDWLGERTPFVKNLAGIIMISASKP